MNRRPKGFAPWDPVPEVVMVLEQVQEILHEYRDYLPMTARQIFYRMVGAFGFEKTQVAYKRLCNYLVRARRARLIPFSAIRDDGTIWFPCYGYSDNHWVRVRACDSVQDYLNELAESAAAYRRDRMDGQDMRIEAWCEAGGMAPQLARVTGDYGIEVYSTGGFSSVTVTYELGMRVANADRPTTLLHIGDFDPSGESLYEVIVEDASRFAVAHGGEPIHPVRVALTEDQVQKYDIPTAPPKASDSRSARWVGETAQAEAIPPDLLATILKDTIEDTIDVDLWSQTLEEEEAERKEIKEKLNEMDWEVSDGT